MWYDVMVRVNETVNEKQVVNTYRVHLQKLNNYLRNVQDVGHYVLGVIPLFKAKTDISGMFQRATGFADKDMLSGLTEQDLLLDDYDDEDMRI